MALSECERRALQKAIRLGGAALVERVRHGVYHVPSATTEGLVYTVTGTAFDASDHRCTCPAGEQGRPCWHVASVRLRRVQETARQQARALQRKSAPASLTCAA